MTADELMNLGPVIAVVTLDDPDTAGPVARALAAGGVRAVEITLRTPRALECVRRAAAEAPDAVVGAGTVVSIDGLYGAIDAGAAFAVAPGATPGLLSAAAGLAIPLLPGAATASEVMAGLEQGYDRFKFFPAEASGGAALLKALASPFAGVRFCPTGGVTPENAADYLALPNVACVGGSWLVTDDLVRARDWGAIEGLARTTFERLQGRP